MKTPFLTLILSSLTVTIMLSSCGPKGTDPAKEAREAAISILKEAVQSSTPMYAHQDDLVYGHSWNVEDPEGDPIERSDVKAVSGHYPFIVGFDLGGIELRDSKNLDSVSFVLMRRAAVKHTERGGLVTFSWHPRNPLTGGDAWDVSSDKVVQSILEGGENHAKFMDWLSAAADFLDSLRDSEGNPIPIIFRPWHEHVGSWFWWGGKLCTPEQYIALYRLTHDYMVHDRGLGNIVWVYSPNSQISKEQYMSRYPGDEYVDALGTDHYAPSGVVGAAPADKKEDAIEFARKNFTEIMDRDLGMINGLCQERGKILVLSETGFEGLGDHAWWTEVLLPLVKKYPMSYVLTWRNAHDKPTHYYAPFPGEPSAPDFVKFSSDPAIKMLP